MKPKKTNILKRINNTDARQKLYFALGFAALAFAACYDMLELPMLLMATWLSYIFATLVLSWITILSSHPADVQHEAHIQDSGRRLVFVFVLAATSASLLSVLFLLKGAVGLSARIFLPMACMTGSWWLVHTVFTMRYAHLYYCDIDSDLHGEGRWPGGLQFPAEEKPDYLDFAYFSFVIGMTFQVSDVQVTSRRIRRLAWMHGILSFAFNTSILAFAINVVSGLISK